MKVSSNALALFCILGSTTTWTCSTTDAFLIRPIITTAPNKVSTKTNTGFPLGYIKEGYDTGIGPNILRTNQKKQKEQQQQQQQHQQQETQTQTQQQEEPVVRPRPSSSSSPLSCDDIKIKGINDDSSIIIDAVVIEEDFYNYNDITEKTDTTYQDAFPDVSYYDDELESSSISGQDEEEEEEEDEASSIWKTSNAKTIQGGSLRTWSMEIPEVDQTQVLMRSKMGRTNEGVKTGTVLRAQLDVWGGPDYVPMKLAVYSSDGIKYPFSCIIPTPGHNKQSIGIKNKNDSWEESTTIQGDNRIEAVVIADDVDLVRDKQQQNQQSQSQSQSQQPELGTIGGGYGGFYSTVGPTTTTMPSPTPSTTPSSSTSSSSPTTGLGSFAETLRQLGDMRHIDGTAAHTIGDESSEVYEFEANVDSVQLLIESSDHLPCQARIEVTNSDDPENILQVIELGIEDGLDRPFFAVLNTPSDHDSQKTTSIRIVNLDKYSAFPLRACVEPYTITDEYDALELEDEYEYDDTGSDTNDDINNDSSDATIGGKEYVDFSTDNDNAVGDDDDDDGDDDSVSTFPDFHTVPVVVPASAHCVNVNGTGGGHYLL